MFLECKSWQQNSATGASRRISQRESLDRIKIIISEKKQCRCPINFIHHFSRDEKLPVKQHQCLGNWIKIGTHLEVFWPRRNERGWYSCLVKSVKWWKNQMYFLVSWDQDKSTSWLHLDHFRLRNLKNKRETQFERSTWLLNQAGCELLDKQMDIDEHRI